MILLVLTIAAWASVALYMTPALLSIFAGSARQGDGARLMCLAWSALMIGFLIRRALVEEPLDASFEALLVASVGIAVMTLQTARGYGRGRRV